MWGVSVHSRFFVTRLLPCRTKRTTKENLLQHLKPMLMAFANQQLTDLSGGLAWHFRKYIPKIGQGKLAKITLMCATDHFAFYESLRTQSNMIQMLSRSFAIYQDISRYARTKAERLDFSRILVNTAVNTPSALHNLKGITANSHSSDSPKNAVLSHPCSGIGIWG